jgi:PAS domain S-box-containing protein
MIPFAPAPLARSLLDALLESSPDAVAGLSLDGSLVAWSAGAEQMFGYSASEILGAPASVLVPTERRAELTAVLNAARRGERVAPFDTEWRRHDGTPVALSVSACPMKDERGRLSGAAVVGRSATARRQAEDELRLSWERTIRLQGALTRMTRAQSRQGHDVGGMLQEILELVAAALRVERVGLWRFSPDRAVLRCEGLFERGPGRHSSGGVLKVDDFLGYFRAVADSEVIAADFADRDPLTRDLAEAYLRPLGITSMLDAPLQVGGVLEGVLCHEHVGPPRHWHPDEQMFAVAAVNLVALALEHESLRMSEERHRDLLESANDLIQSVDEQGRVVYANRAWRQALGYPAEGTDVFEVIAPEFRDSCREVLRRAIAGGGPLRVETVFVAKDGRRIAVEGNVTGNPANGKPGMSLGIFRDITERKRAEETLREANRRLEETVLELRRTQHLVIQQERLRALGQMAAGMAHDFNNVLVPIQGFSDLLLSDPGVLADVRRSRDYVLLIRTAAQDAARIVARLRDLYGPPSRGDTFLPVRLDLVAAQAVALARPKWKDEALAGGRTIEVVPDLLPVPPVPGLESDLRQVVTNLVFNAVDAMPRGGKITLRTRQEGGDVLLEVRDTGVGMTAEVRHRCLEPFFTTKQGRGSGLGLSIAHSVLRRHGGSIEVDSEPGVGTGVTLRVPTGGAVRPAEPGAAPDRPRSLHLLAVDDDPTVLKVLEALLGAEGHTVETAGDGQEALERFAAGRFDLVISDQAMPRLNGWQLAEAIQKVAPGKPFLLLTGFAGEAAESGRVSGRPIQVLEKPVTLQMLREALARVTRVP